MKSDNRSSLVLLLSMLWVLGFLFVFFRQSLPNNPDITRTDFAFLALDNLAGLLNPFDVSHAAPENIESGWHLLPQRWPFYRTAAILFATATGLGGLLLHCLIPGGVLTRSERFVLAAGLGLSLQSLWTLIIGQAGHLSPGLLLAPGGLALILLTVGCVLRSRNGESQHHTMPDDPAPASSLLKLAALAALLPFAILLILNSVTPPFDFDVIEYHLQGPKEWFQTGQITFLSHNVYTSFPFLSEMLSLDAMVLLNDWDDGALGGKALLGSFQLLSCLAVYTIARRWFGTAPALLASVICLSVPWTQRITCIAYAEGAITFYLTATVLAGLLTISTPQAGLRLRLTAVTGLLAGSAMAAKYPGVVSVVIPTGLCLAWCSRRSPRDLVWQGSIYSLAVLCAVGPWLARNFVDTGNPVYPLLDSVFQSAEWSANMDSKWKAGHSAPEHDLRNIPVHVAGAVLHNDWTSGLLFALAVPVLWLWRRQSQIRWLWLMVLWMLATWWALTHRIDRFWIPIIPVTAILAGAAWILFSATSWRALLLTCVAGTTLFQLQICRTGLLGQQAGLVDLPTLRSTTVRRDLQKLNQELSMDDKVLMVGEAAVFHVQIPLLYNTVFDESLFELWTADPADNRTWSSDRRMLPPEDVRAALLNHGITHIYVNWLEIKRYRSPGSYPYTDYVMPDRFQQLVTAGVLSKPKIMALSNWKDLPSDQQQVVAAWSGHKDLLVAGRDGAPQSWTPLVLYRVLPQPPE